MCRRIARSTTKTSITGIDVVYYGNQRELEYDFVVAPGANPKVIKFRVEGAERIRLDESGSLLLALKEGEVRLNKPFIYQLAGNGSRNEIKGAYAINGKEISFKVRGFDSDKPLVIDPVLSYSTFLGSTGSEVVQGIAVDSQGSAYVTGFTDVSHVSDDGRIVQDRPVNSAAHSLPNSIRRAALSSIRRT